MTTSRAAAVLALFALLSSYAWSPCVGWQATAALRAACCEAADHACSEGAVDDCCAQGEQRQNASSAGAVTLSPPPITSVVLLAPAERPVMRAAPWDTPQPKPRLATHLRLSVLLV